MAFTNLSNEFYEIISSSNDNDDVDTGIAFRMLVEKVISYKRSPDNIIIHSQNYESIISGLVSIKNILDCPIHYLSSQNCMVKIKLLDLLKLMRQEHYHQNMPCAGLPSAFPNKKSQSTVSCNFHEESLFEHSVMAMFISMFHAVNTDKDCMKAGLTALFHDVGKINTMCIFGNNLGYPFHGSYGAAILSQYGSDELYEIIGGKKVWADICRSIGTHMCSYHSTETDGWSRQRRTISQLENLEVKNISECLSYGDTFGKISKFSSAESDEVWLKSRPSYNEFVMTPFNASYIKDNGFSTVAFFIRGQSGSGKTTFIQNKLLPFLRTQFQESQFVIISRDEIMANLTAMRTRVNLSSPRPTGAEYASVHNNYRTLKLSKVVNDEIRKRISIAISQGRIPIIDSCILYYTGIDRCMPDNISKAFIIAIDCVRNTPYTTIDAEKNGMLKEELTKLFSYRTPVKWIDSDIRLTILDSVYTHNSNENLPTYIPQLVFQYGWNPKHSVGFESMTETLEPIIQYFSQNLSPINTDDMTITSYVNYLYKKFGLKGMKDAIGSQSYRITDSHNDPRILRMNYLEHNRLWRPKWSRQTRGTSFWLNDSDEWVCIKSLLERGTEALTSLHVIDGITETDNMNVDDIHHTESSHTESSHTEFSHTEFSRDDLISQVMSNMIEFDEVQIKFISQLLFNQELSNEYALSFKKDGSLLGCTLYNDKIIEAYMKAFISESDDLFAKCIMKMCERMNIPLLVFSTQSTILVGIGMHDYTVNALLSSLVMGDDKLASRYTDGDYIKAFEEDGEIVLTYLYRLISSIRDAFGGTPNDSITLSMESICKDRRSVFKGALVHTELALSYDESSITVLGASFANDSDIRYYPHYEFSTQINQIGMSEPAYWYVSHTNEINELLKSLHLVIYGEITEEEFYSRHPPNNLYDNSSKIVDYEGFVSYSKIPTQNGTLNYNKIKTTPYYDLHKLKKNKMQRILQYAENPNIAKHFPMCDEVKYFYTNLDKITLIVDNFLAQATEPNSQLFQSLSEKAQISFVKQKPNIQLKMLINAPNGFAESAIRIFNKSYPFNLDKAEQDLLDEISSVVKNILMNSLGGVDIEFLKKNGIIDTLFLVVRKAIAI